MRSSRSIWVPNSTRLEPTTSTFEDVPYLINSAVPHRPIANTVCATRFITRERVGLGVFEAAQPTPRPGCSRNQPPATVTMPQMSAGRKVGAASQAGPRQPHSGRTSRAPARGHRARPCRYRRGRLSPTADAGTSGRPSPSSARPGRRPSRGSRPRHPSGRLRQSR